MNSIIGLPLDSMRNSGLSPNSTDTKPPVNAVTAVILFSALSAVIAIVNTLVIVVIWKDPFKELKGSSANYLILNLAICDLLTGFPGILLRGLLSLPLNDNLFYATLTCIWIPSVASILTIVSLAFERLIVVSYPIRSADYLTIRCFKVWITLIWTAAVFPCSFVYMGSKTYYTVVAFIWADVAGVVIILLLLACYIRIYILVRKTLYLDITTVEERRAEGEALTENARRKTNARKKERKVLRTVLILTAVFLTCWIPDFVIENLNKGCNCFRFPVVQGLLVTLPPLLNPLCYALCTAKFRRALLKIWSGLLDHKSYYTFRC